MSPAVDRRSDLEALRDRLAQAHEMRLRVVERTTNTEIVETLAAVGRCWRDPAYRPRCELVARLAPRLSIDEGMLARGLDHTFGALNEVGLTALLAEADPAAAIERPVQRKDARTTGPARLLGPPVVTYLLAGNVPGLAIFPIAASLLARSVCVLRESFRQPLLTEAFVATVAEHSKELACMIVHGSWPAENRELMRIVSATSMRVEIFGCDDTVERVSETYRRAEQADLEIVERGTRTSAAVVTGSVDLDLVAEGLSEDIVLYDGKGCLTPHQIIVEGEPRQAYHLAERLGAALCRFEARWPRHIHEVRSESTRRAFLAAAEASALAHADERLLHGENDAWAIHLTPRGRVRVGPGLRCVEVVCAPSCQHALALLAASEAPLAAVAVAAPEGVERDRLTARLREIGATLVCEPGQMQAPPLTWQQDGRRRLGDLLAWRACEPCGEIRP